MRLFLTLIFLAYLNKGYAQTIVDSQPEHSTYFEDQLYLGVSYNFIRNLPENANQRNFSYGLMGGFIKDVPLNKLGTFAVGIGAGLAVNSYYSNLVASEGTSNIDYSVVTSNLKRSKLETHLVELPLEFRWRNSTAEEYKFWRIYAGIKVAYVLGARSKFADNDLDVKNGFFNTNLNPFQYGLTLSFGYNTFNIHAYYALTDLYDGTANINGEVLQFTPLRVGLIFYIL